MALSEVDPLVSTVVVVATVVADVVVSVDVVVVGMIVVEVVVSVGTVTVVVVDVSVADVTVVCVVPGIGRLLVLVDGTGVVQSRPVNSGTQSTLKFTLKNTRPPILVPVEPVVADDPGLPPIRLKRWAPSIAILSSTTTTYNPTPRNSVDVGVPIVGYAGGMFSAPSLSASSWSGSSTLLALFVIMPRGQ